MASRRTTRPIRSGPSSLVVVIPKDWARGMEVGPGTELEMEYDGQIVIWKKGDRRVEVSAEVSL